MKLLILGNGFDLAFGYWTSYSSFVNTVVGTTGSFWPFRYEPKGKFMLDCLHRHFFDFVINQNGVGNVRWIDIEGELLNYAIKRSKDIVNSELLEQDELSYERLCQCLYQYLRAIYPDRRDSKVDLTVPIQILNAIKVNGQFEKIYTFNYTDPSIILTQFAHFSEPEISKINYVHGSLKNNNIVLGINEDKTVPLEYDFLFKCDKIAPNLLPNDLLKADEVIIYGLSFGTIDGIYFKPFLERISTNIYPDKKPKLTFLTYDSDSEKFIRRSLRQMGLSREQLNNSLELRIIPVSEINYKDAVRHNYNEFIRSLELK